MISERDRIRAGSEQAIGELRRDADAVCDVLAVDDAQIGPQLVAERRQALLDRAPAGDADDVGDKQDSQGRVRGAERMAIETWSPASCV